MEQFTDFAYIYDKLNVNYNKEEIIERLSLLLYSEKNIVDVCCGTGDVAIGLSKKGFKVTGVDISEDMLNVANEKAAKSMQRVMFLCQDMKKLELLGKADAVYSVCDGMNYMLSVDEVKAAVNSVGKVLKSGGTFIFDVSTEHKYVNKLKGNTFTFDFDDCFLSWQNDYNEKTRICTMNIVGFEKKTKNTYIRFDETHKQRSHTVEELKGALCDCGFDAINIFSGYSDKVYTDKDDRILFVTRKRG